MDQKGSGDCKDVDDLKVGEEEDLAVLPNNDNPDGVELLVPDAGVVEGDDENQEENVVDPNPFELPEVVSHFCNYLAVEDLKKFRLMNKMINIEVCQVLRKKQKQVFKSVKDISTYTKIMDEGILHFHEIFVLNQMDLSQMTAEEVSTMNDFLAQFGPRVKKCYITLNEKTMLPHDWWTLLYNMPNLEELEVTIGPHVYIPMDPKDFGCTVFEVENVSVPAPPSPGPARRVAVPAVDPMAAEYHGPFGGRAERRRQPHLLRLQVGELMDLEDLMDLDFDWDDEVGDLPGGSRRTSSAQQSTRLTKPQFTQEERNLFGSLVPKLCLKRLKRLHFTLRSNAAISEATFNFIQIILAACHSSLASIETDSFSTDVFLGKVIFDCLKNSELRFPRMKALNLWVKLDENDVVFLGTLPHLSKIKVVLREGIQRATFHRLIYTCCSSLTHLGLVIQNSQLRCSLDMNCYLPKLQYFKLLGYRGSLLFLRHMPVLQVLDLYTGECRYLMDALINSDGKYNVQSLKELTAIKLTRSGPPVGIFLGSVNSLPNLVRLELDSCDDDLMELVYKAMPNLKELKVSGTFSDVGITGIARQNCEEILTQCAHFVVEDRLVRQYLFIGNLTKLKRLSLTSENISDLSVMFGVAKLLKLRSLTVAGSKITEIGVEVIKSYMVLEHLNLSGCPNVSEAALSKISDVWGSSIFNDDVSSQSSNQPNWSELMSFNHREYLPLPEAREFNENMDRVGINERFARMRAHMEHRGQQGRHARIWHHFADNHGQRRAIELLDVPDNDDEDPEFLGQFMPPPDFDNEPFGGIQLGPVLPFPRRRLHPRLGQRAVVANVPEYLAEAVRIDFDFNGDLEENLVNGDGEMNRNNNNGEVEAHRNRNDVIAEPEVVRNDNRDEIDEDNN